MASLLLHGVFAFVLLNLPQVSSKVNLVPLGQELLEVDFLSSTANSIEMKKKDKIVLVQKKLETNTNEKNISDAQNTPQASTDSVGEFTESQKDQTSGANLTASQNEGDANGVKVSIEERYIYELQKLIERKKRYPPLAKAMGQAGLVQLKITLDQNGKILETLVLNQAHESLIQAARELMKQIDGVKPFPQGLNKTTWSFQVPVHYSLR